MTPKQLKNSILQRAIEGRLVPQCTDDGTADELLSQIRIEKEQLIADGKLKREKTLPPIDEKELPFAIPASWRWVRLGEVCQKIGSGNTPKGGRNSDVYKLQGIPFLREQNIHDCGIQTKGLVYISKELSEKRNGSKVYAKDLLLNITGASIGRCAIVPDEFIIGDINQHILILRLVEKNIREYIHFYICSPSSQSTINKKAVGAKAGFSSEKCKNMLIPLPPLAEQKRIVAKINELMPLLDRYERAYNELTVLDTKFPDQLKKSLLQYAIQGKLVPQCAADGTADELLTQIRAEKEQLIANGKIKREKPLPSIDESELPFAIPASWRWVRLGEMCTLERGSGLKREEITTSGLPCIRYGELYTTYKIKFCKTHSFTSQKVFDKCHKVETNDILMALTGENKQDIALAVTYLGETPIAMGGDMAKCCVYQNNSLYLVYVLNSPYGIIIKQNLATGNIIVHISNEKLSSIPIPLPPLVEQYLIVDKINELMAQVGRLTKVAN